MESSSSKPSPLALLRNPGYLRLWLGQITSTFGDYAAYMGLSFLILYRLGGNAVDLAKLTIAATIPTLVIGPIAGTFVDRWSRRRTMVVADIVRGLIYLGMPFVGSLTLAYIGVFLSSVMSRFFSPAKSAILPNIVQRDSLMAANGLSQATHGILAVLGPASGAALAGLIGSTMTFYINSATFFISALLIAGIRGEEAPVADANWKGVSQELARVKDDLTTGLRFIVRNRVVRFYVAVFAVFGFLSGGLNVIIIPFLKDVMGFQMPQVGLAESCLGLGGLLGALAMSTRRSVRPTKVIPGAIALQGPAIVSVFGINRSLYGVFPIALVLGFLMASFQVPLNSQLMELVPDRMRGRVFGSFGALTDGLQLTSMAIIPALSVKLGTAQVGTAIGVLLLLLGLGGLAAAGRLSLEPPSTPVTVSE